MKKLAILLALVLAFFACAEEDTSVIATFDGGEVRFQEIYGDYEGLAAVYAALYGEDAGERADIAIELTTRLVNDLIREKLLLNYADSFPGSLLSADDRAEIEQRAMRDYKLLYEESLPVYLADDELTEEEARSELANDLAEIGLDYESYLAEYTRNAEMNAALAKLAGNVKVTNEQVSERYNSKLREDTEYFSAYPEDYPFAYFYADQTVLYIPEGLRLVRLYYIDMPETEITALSAMGDMKSIMKYAVSAEHIYGEAGGENGAPVCANCAIFEEEILDAALALKKAGDLSAPIAIESGYIVVEFKGNLKPGSIPLKNVKDEIYNMIYSEQQQIQGQEKLDEMFENANVQYFLYRLG